MDDENKVNNKLLHFYFIGYILGLVSGALAFSGTNPVIILVACNLLYLGGFILLKWYKGK